MATLATSQQWLHQSSLLLEARPQTTKITFRYSVKPKPARRTKKAAAKTGDDATLPDAPAKAATAAGASSAHQNPRAKLVLRTIDPASGVCLKYKTTKAAEVSRLVQLLGRLSRRQAGLVSAATAAAEEAESNDVAMAEADAAEPASASASASTPAAAPSPAPTPTPGQQQQQQQTGGGGGGGKGKKKKGKR